MRRARGVGVRAGTAGLALWLAACAGGAGEDSTGAVLKRLEIVPATASVPAGRTQQFTAMAVYHDDSTMDVTDTVSWSSSLPWTATVDAGGRATSRREGLVEIRAKLGHASATAVLAVTEPVVERLRVDPADAAVPRGGAVAYRATGGLSDGTERDVTGDATWSSSNSSVATTFEDPFGGRHVEGHGYGSAIIRAVLGELAAETAVTVVTSALYGGGDMLAALAYVGRSWFNVFEPGSSRRLTYHRHPPDSGSLFASLAPDIVTSFCQTGDDVAKMVYAGMDSARADSTCGDYSNWPQGFSAVAGPGGRPHFVAAEMPLNAEEYTRMQEIRLVNPVQIPSVAASIAISYNNPEIHWKLNLTTEQLRGIFSGVIRTWDQIAPVSAQPIRVVYRADYSAATFALSNHLSCTPVNSQTRPCGGHAIFNTSHWFPEVVEPVPDSWIAAGSNAAAGAKVLETAYSIGYGEAADLALRYRDLKLAEVNAIDPLLDLRSPVISVYPNECVISGYGPSTASCYAGQAVGPTPDGRPVITDPDTQTFAQNPCAVLVNPDSYAAPVPVNPEDPPVYPILSISYLLAYNAFNGDNAPEIRRLLLAPYSGVRLAPGFAPLSGWAPTPELIASCVAP